MTIRGLWRIALLLAVAVGLSSCMLFGLLSGEARLPVRVDLGGANAVGREVAKISGEIESNLVKRMSTGEFFQVPFYNKYSKEVDLETDLVSIQRLNSNYSVLLYGRISLPDALYPDSNYASISDCFLLDHTTENLYYLNMISLPAVLDHEHEVADYAYVDDFYRNFSATNSGLIYYQGGTRSGNNYTGDSQDIRSNAGIVRVSINPESEIATGEYITPDTEGVGRFAISSGGDMIYQMGDQFVYRLENGTTDFWNPPELQNAGPTLAFTAADGNIYISENDLALYKIVSFNPEPQMTLIVDDTLTRFITVLDDHIRVICSQYVYLYYYAGNTKQIDFPSAIAPRQIISKGGTYLYIRYNSTDANDPVEYALCVDLESEIAVEYTYDHQRFKILELSESLEMTDTVLVCFEDVLTGVESTYELFPNGDMVLLGTRPEDTYIVQLEPFSM